MNFTCEGKTYNVAELTAYATGDPAVPTVYVTPDFRCVFVQTVDQWKGDTIRLADDVDIKSLAARYGLPQLRRALQSRTDKG